MGNYSLNLYDLKSLKMIKKGHQRANVSGPRKCIDGRILEAAKRIIVSESIGDSSKLVFYNLDSL